MAMSSGAIQNKMLSILMIVVFVVAIIQVITSTISLVFTNLGYLADNFTAQNVPFASFFSSGGIMSLVYGLVILVLIISAFFAMGSGLGKKGR